MTIIGFILSIALAVAILRIISLQAKLAAIRNGLGPALQMAYQKGRADERAAHKLPPRPIEERERAAYELGVAHTHQAWVAKFGADAGTGIGREA